MGGVEYGEQTQQVRDPINGYASCAYQVVLAVVTLDMDAGVQFCLGAHGRQVMGVGKGIGVAKDRWQRLEAVIFLG